MDEIKRFTREEVKKNGGRQNTQVLFIYKDSVHDITSYVNKHPGGTNSILWKAGKDGSHSFDQVGHSNKAKEILAKLKIGELVEEEKWYDANGKKKKVIPGKKSKRSCLSICTFGYL